MGQEKENRKQENRAGRIFEATRAEFIRVLANPLVPCQIRDHSRSILSRVRILDDDAFLAEVVKSCQLPATEEILAEIAEEANASHAIFFPGGRAFEKDQIIVKESYLEREPAASEYFFDLLAEEVAHSISAERRFKVSSIPDKALALLPFFTKEELYSSLREKFALFFQRDVDPSQTIAVIRGFQTDFQTEEGERVPVMPAQVIFEESRAAILLTLFEIFRDMERNFTPGELGQRFEKSMQNLENLADLDFQYERERAAIGFLKVYLKRPKELKDLIKDLFFDLGGKIADQFIPSLTEEEQEAFLESVKSTNAEFSSRPERAAFANAIDSHMDGGTFTP